MGEEKVGFFSGISFWSEERWVFLVGGVFQRDRHLFGEEKWLFLAGSVFVGIKVFGRCFGEGQCGFF